MPFELPYFSKDELRRRAEDFLAEYHGSREIPVPIELITEAQFQMDIVPVPELQSTFDVVAYITKDLTEIRVDRYIYSHRQNRYRFSLAHELGHRILHADLWKQFEFHDIASWKAAVTDSIPEEQYGLIEHHANFFAGLVLVPPRELQASFEGCVTLAREQGIDIRDEMSGGKTIIESHLGRRFEVSSVVIHRRLEADGLWGQLG